MYEKEAASKISPDWRTDEAGTGCNVRPLTGVGVPGVQMCRTHCSSQVRQWHSQSEQRSWKDHERLQFSSDSYRGCLPPRQAVSSEPQRNSSTKQRLIAIVVVNAAMAIGPLSSMRIVFLVMSVLMSSDAKSLLRTSRKLQTTAQSFVFEVPLSLALHFVSESTASALESKDSANDIVRHLCDVVQKQVRRQC